MNKVVVTAKETNPPASPLSPGIASGGFVFVSGQTAPDESGIAAQTRAVLEKVGRVLSEAGTDFRHVVRCGVFLRDAADVNTMNEVYRDFFPTHPPARSTIVCSFVRPGALIEIDCIAALTQAKGQTTVNTAITTG